MAAVASSCSFAFESDPVPLTRLVGFQAVPARPSDTFHRAKELCERKAALSPAFFGEDAPTAGPPFLLRRTRQAFSPEKMRFLVV